MFKQKTFELTDEQYKKINRWAKTHKCNLRHKSCCGGEISITFTPTSIGMFVKANCLCGKSKDVSEV